MIEGSCLCGGIQYRFDEKGAVLMNHCHCSRCRKASGAEYATFLQVVGDYFEWVSGEELVAAYESAPGNFRTFCRVCGSRAPVVREEHNAVTIPVGTLEGDPGLRPAMHLFTRSKAEWYRISDDLPQFAEMGTPEDWQPYIDKARGLARR
jgi:hypothetical protein